LPPFAAATALANPPAPQAAVAAQSCEPPAGTKGYAAIRAIDEPGNIGLPPVVRVR
jgi:hypothetical protein